MAELSLMRAMFARMEERQALATTGSSGSGSRPQATSSRAEAPARAASPTPKVVKLPINKTSVTIASIRADLGVSENDRRWREIRVSDLAYSCHCR